MAYAAAITLKHTILRLKNPFNNPQITKSANEELDSLGCMLRTWDDRIRSIDRNVTNAYDAKIRDAVWKLEDVLESSLLPPSHGLDPKGAERGVASCLEAVIELREDYLRELQRPLSKEEDDAAVSQIDNGFGGNTPFTIGLPDQTHEIINELLDWQPELKTVSLVGMAGIGKTHLATQIYQHPLILQDFDSRLWVSIGPKDQVSNISVDIVSQIECKPRDPFKGKSKGTLREILRNSLRGRKYLIVLDDIWSIRVMNYFIELLPNYENGSRFLVTTRQQEIAEYQRCSKIYQMPFLSNEESWNLLWKNVFAEKSFPFELEKVGRKIAEKCEGLPLLILAVAHILSGQHKTQEFWKKVADNKTTTFPDAYDKIYKVLLPSYEYLPQHLKPCFLYIGIFPQSCEISFSKLINLWAVEDFIEPSLDKKFEDFAMECMKDIVSKSLALVCKRSFERVRKIKSLKLHSVYYYLCVKEARKNKFFHVLNKLTDVSEHDIESQRRLSIQNNILLGIKEVYDSMAAATPTTRSLLCTGVDHQYPVQIFLKMKLLKVLHALAIRFYQFPKEVVKLLQLRYLSTLHVNARSCTHGVFTGIPNLKRLGITIELQPNVVVETLICLEHIGLFNRLESLKCVVVNPRLGSHLDHIPNFSRVLEKLSLNGLGYSWKHMSVIGSLPNLKVLKLRCFACQGPDWETEARQFKSLEFLLLEDLIWCTGPLKIVSQSTGYIMCVFEVFDT